MKTARLSALLIRTNKLKVSQPQVQSNALTSSRVYSSEANEYVYHIKAGNIAGVHPSVIDQCQVCSKILREMNGHSDHNFHNRAPVADVEVEVGTNNTSRQGVLSKVWIAMWILHHESHAMEAEC